MAVTAATLGRDVIGNISHFDCEFPESYSGDPTKLTRHYESRPNTLFGRGMPKEETMLSVQCVLGIHDRAKTSFHRASIL